MLEIAVVRHGETSWNKERRLQGNQDIPLSDHGRYQALCIANRLAGERWDAVYSSCLKRAAETADLIASKCGVEKVVRDRRLREKHFGLLEGTTQEERLMRWGEHPDLAELGVESAESIYGRAHRFLEDLSGRYDHHRIVVVTHGGWIRELFMRLFPDNAKDHPLNTSLSIIRFSEGLYTCSLYNCTKHLGSCKKDSRDHA